MSTTPTINSSQKSKDGFSFFQGFPRNFFNTLHKTARTMILFLPTLASIVTAILLGASLSKVFTAGAVTLGATSTILLVASLADH